MAQGLDELQADLDEITQLREQYNKASDVTKKIKQQMDLKREQVLFGLQANKLKSLKNNKLTVSITEKVSIKIIGQTEIINWLEMNNFDPTEYMKVDSARVEPLAKAQLKETGEILPGCELERNQYITVKENK